MLSSEPDSEGLSNIQTPTSFGHQNTPNQASSDEDGRLRTVNPSTCPCGTDQNLSLDRPSQGQIRTLDQDNYFEMDEWTDFRIWTIKISKCGRVDKSTKVRPWRPAPWSLTHTNSRRVVKRIETDHSETYSSLEPLLGIIYLVKFYS